MSNDQIVLCGSNSYEKKYYLDERFQRLPQQIKDELQIMCVLYTEDVGGILTLVFEEDGDLVFHVTCDEGDLLFDEIGSVLKIKRLKNEKKELLESLELYYRIVILKQDVKDILNKVSEE